MAYWLSYGGGVNSTALAVLAIQGDLGRFYNAKIIFSDTGNERPETLTYIQQVFIPYLHRHGRELIVVKPQFTVLERWQKYRMTGSRMLRSCTDHAKIRPMQQYIRPIDPSPEQLIGIDAGEPHRAKPANKKKREFPKHYPLVNMGIDRDGCSKIIKAAGLCIPIKSGCWHCPFMRVREVLGLAQNRPSDFQTIIALEDAQHQRYGEEGKDDRHYQWRDKPATYWMSRATQEARQGCLDFEWDDVDPNIPCECLDG